MGGLVAAAYAANPDAELLARTAQRFGSVRQMLELLDWFPAHGALVSSHRLERLLRNLLGLERGFDALQIPLALTAVDLASDSLVTIQEGSVLEAVRATIAIPGVFSPVIRSGAHLVDGGILNNLPVEALPLMGVQATIAVDVGFQLGEQPVDHQLPWLRSLPEPAGELYHAVALMMTEMTRARLREHPPDLLLEPDIPSGVGILTGFPRVAEIIAAGERAAMEAMPEIRRLRLWSAKRWWRALQPSPRPARSPAGRRSA
jgi:NTE family protein